MRDWVEEDSVRSGQPRRAIRVAGLTVVAGLIATSCANGSPQTGTTSGRHATHTTSTTAAGPAGIPTDPRLTVTNDVAARRDVSATSCHSEAGGLVMSGTVTNSTAAPATYRLQITYVDLSATIQDVEKTSVRLAAGQSKSWSTTWKTSNTSGFNCVLDAVSRS
jgi:hypothetical protein